MVNRICISINNRCNLNCSYCHFNEKQEYINAGNMNVYKILENVINHIDKYKLEQFKIGFVGNGEPLIDFNKLRDYILYINNYIEQNIISVYTITNGLLIDEKKLSFFKEHKVNVGFSIDGIKSIHDKLRCNSYDDVIKGIKLYYNINRVYPPMNCTVGNDVLNCADDTIAFFEKFNSRITFSRMIGKFGISYEEFHCFMDKAAKKLNVRTGGYDCTMYGGMCGAGINNFYFANGRAYLCGNCIDLPISFPSETPLDKIDFKMDSFDRNFCFKERRLI